MDARKDGSPWAQELCGSVQGLQQRTLLRVQRPTLPQFSSVEVILDMSGILCDFAACAVTPVADGHDCMDLRLDL
eukprot:117180-Pelagomonas_calceolata.AAC.3